ncbi:MAG: hypothetical protein V9E89_19370 [Ilumatobacteraceae bacterium]
MDQRQGHIRQHLHFKRVLVCPVDPAAPPDRLNYLVIADGRAQQFSIRVDVGQRLDDRACRLVAQMNRADIRVVAALWQSDRRDLRMGEARSAVEGSGRPMTISNPTSPYRSNPAIALKCAVSTPGMPAKAFSIAM